MNRSFNTVGSRLPDAMACQTFRQGCCGCCVNMRWKPVRIAAFLDANTHAAEATFCPGGRPRLGDLVRLHLARGGWRDHLLAFWLVPLTLGLSAWLWRRRYGSCCFAGYLDRAEGRVGCLIHPARWGGPDLRRHAFPLVPTLGCDRALECPMLGTGAVPADADWLAVSRAGAASLRRRP
jgi:hypothetical protein